MDGVIPYGTRHARQPNQCVSVLALELQAGTVCRDLQWSHYAFNRCAPTKTETWPISIRPPRGDFDEFLSLDGQQANDGVT